MRNSFTSGHGGSQSQDSIHSPKYLLTLPKSALDIEIVQHRLDGEGIMYDEHIFIIDIHCESIYYSVERSYVDFVELYFKLKKKFPHCEIPNLPLDSTNQLQKLLKKDDGRKGIDSRKSVGAIESPRKSLGANESSPHRDSIKLSGKSGGYRIDSFLVENVEKKIPELQLYMRSLLTFHEIVVSEEFAMFLDEERPSNIVFTFIKSDALNEVELLLASTPAVTSSVRNLEEVTLDVLPGQLVIWKFYLESYDIGFQVEVGGELKVSYTRYSGVESNPVIGSLEVGMRGLCILKWDNSYAKLRSKVLTRQVRVVDPDQYNIARNSCLEVQREKRKYELQRRSLKHATLRHAAAVSGVIHSSSVENEIDEENVRILNETKEELEQTKKEKEDISTLLQRTLAEVEELHEQNNELNTHIDKTAARMAELDEELAVSDRHIDDLEAQIQTIQTEKAELELQIKDLADIVDAASVASQLAAENERKLLDQFQKQYAELEAQHQLQIEQAIADCAQSSSSNIDLNEDNVRLKLELSAALTTISNLENDKTLLEEQTKDLENSLQSLHLRETETQLELVSLRQKCERSIASEQEVQHLLEVAKNRVLRAESLAEQHEEALTKSNERVTLLEEQIDRIKWRSKEEIDEMSLKINRLENELSGTSNLLQLSQIDQDERQSQAQTLLHESHQKILQLTEEITQLKVSLVKSDGRTHELTQELEEARNHLSQKNAECLSIRQELVKSEAIVAARNDQFQQDLLKNQATISQLEITISNHQHELKTSRQSLEILENELTSEKLKSESFLSTHHELEKQIMELRFEIKTVNERNEELRNSLENNQRSQLSHSSFPISQSLDRALQDLREEREKFDNYRANRDKEVLELHKLLISSQEKLELIQNQNRDVNENFELERKNRLAILTDTKNELLETKNELKNALNKVSDLEYQLRQQSHFSISPQKTKLTNGASRGFQESDSEEEEENDDDLERAILVKHHRDLAAARAEIADYAHQLVESARREDEMQQCITDLQQEVSMLFSRLGQFQQQLQVQNQTNHILQSTTAVVNEKLTPNGKQSSKFSHEFMTPNYELIEKYKELYSSTLETCRELEQEIIREKESMNNKVYNVTNQLHQEIAVITNENTELKKELYEMKQLQRETINKRRQSDASNQLTNELIEKHKQLYLEAIERCQVLENEILHERELNNTKIITAVSQITDELNQMKSEKDELMKELFQFQQLYQESLQQIEQLEKNGQEKEKELRETKEHLKMFRSSFQDIAKPLSRLLSQEESA